MKWLPENPNTRLTVKLTAIVSFMFVFAIFIMPPMYDAFCEITGLNGKTGDQYQAVDVKIDTSREIKIQFVATNNEGMPWQFGPEVKTVTVHPGEQTRINYLAKNTTGRDMIGQAVPSLIPYKAASYFHKTECFCFNQQALLAGTEAVLPMYFIVDQDLPEYIKTITLSYTLFDATDRFSKEELLSMAEAGPVTLTAEQ
ncbi:cytochrome c oxidase assembly protein [Gilvimarinus agarilyticus]|uniref:cytochrome c oxidase assembly protein n=1 Tax=unclassified Gilvimarinus TaxID=2642066 RepID=UPI001C08DDD9|nr:MULTISPECIES: cytochrome c oxidase assembly protein [unclassified Gilvimarinus]MBU2884264.1 cytochrome c oxidase assembly protein [Gilvimarinus agarilyticus]MDO6569403.1 cytochrome c oxidase assembly protein [Gilvimarinus sp. 2_MG-2023]MDO6747557.1 cytochrome c oxidase assembly protein [Gilvimarinus sp. 1_MG-2023]